MPSLFSSHHRWVAS